MPALIYKPARTAMQSGQALTKRWVLEFTPEKKRWIGLLMGWTGSADPKSQIRLYFATKEDAIAYATKEGIPYRLEEPSQRRIKPKAYADNFRYDRIGRWTH